MANVANTVVIPARANTPQALFLPFYAKHPADTVQYCIDASGFLAYAGRTIVGTPTITEGTGEITISQISAGGGLTNFLVSGGLDLRDYFVTWSAQLDNDTSLTRVITLPIRSLFFGMTGAQVVAKGDTGEQGPPGSGLTGEYTMGGDGNLTLTALSGGPVVLLGFVTALTGPAAMRASFNAMIAANAIPTSNNVTGTNAGLCTDGDFLCTGRTTG